MFIMSIFRKIKSGVLFFALIASAATIFLATSAQAQIALNIADSKAAPVTVQSAEVTAEVTGRFAVTTFDLVFANPNNRVLEGTFEFPLLDGQRVVRFALDINGALREAVPVEREKGRVVFEEIERRGVDPGLLEQTAGNNYRARIFPIPANGTRRIVIAYQEDLRASSAANVVPHYRLALDFPGVLKTFNLTAKVFGAAGASAPKATTTLALELPEWRDAQTLSVKKENFAARGLLELELPAASAATNAHPAVITETFNSHEYFYAEAGLPSFEPKPRPAPKVVGILWDASGSGRSRDHEREFALLDTWFAAVGDVDVKLVCLRNAAAAPVAFKVRDGKWGDVRAALEKTVYDGATSFDGLADDAAVDEWLLFSDGLVNFGATQTLDKLPLRAPVHAVNASASAAPAVLRGLAARGGGEYADLLALDAKTAAARLRQYSLRVVAVERDPEAVAQVFPEAGAPVNVENGALIVTGVLRKPSATVRVKVGSSEADAQTIEVVVKSGEGASTLAARAWALAKIDHLATAAGDNHEDILRTAQEFRIVTADTSLIVLETVDDYIRYDIEPPAELRDEWLKRRSETEATFNKNREQHIERVVQLFNERSAWWEKKFPKDAPPKLDHFQMGPNLASGFDPNGIAPRDLNPNGATDANGGTIGRVVFEGNKKIKDEQLAAEVRSKPRGTFSRATVESDTLRIAEIYRRLGRYDVRVTPKIIQQRNNRVDLVFRIEEGARTGVKSIEFVGNNAFPGSRLKDVIKTHESSLLSFLGSNGIYDRGRVEADRDLLRRFYLKHGFVDVKVGAARTEYDRERKGFRITFRIEEGQQYRVGSVEFRSSIPNLDPNSLRSFSRVSVGSLYNVQSIERSIEEMQIEASRRGFTFAVVRSGGDRDLDAHTVSVVFNVDEGPHTYIERINIRGNTRTRDYVIRREFDISEGDVYNSALVDRAERRLKNLDYFKTVKITPRPGSSSDRVILDVELEEKSTGDFSIQGGYSTTDDEIRMLDHFQMGPNLVRGFDPNGTGPRDLQVDFRHDYAGVGGDVPYLSLRSALANSPASAPLASIALQRWSPVASYLDHIRRVPASERFSAYLEERADHAREPGFYLDVAGYFFDEAKDAAAGLQILSNLAELSFEDAPLLRVLGYRLVQAERPDLALPVFERVLKIRGEEPQSRRDLALVCEKLGLHQRAVDLLWDVVSRPWDGRFPEIELIALEELNAIVAARGEMIDVSKIDARLLKDMPVGLRVVLTWDADNCDIDLWVDDPNGERAKYDHPLTYEGGRMSRDFTAGYGPEEFLVRAPKPGKYTVRINYYGDRRQTALGPVTAQVRLITGFGTPQQKDELITVRLVDRKESLEIGSIEIGK